MPAKSTPPLPYPPAARALKSALRRWLGRDWYPASSKIDVQGAISGEPAMFCALAWQGRMIGGYSGTKLELSYPNGPSALGCTGFISFDFMIEEGSGRPLLIECNPRPVPVTHLGGRIGVDLAGELAALLAGAEARAVPLRARTELDVLLFPHALDISRHRPGRLADLPIGDPGLISHVTRAAPARTRGASLPGWPRRARAVATAA